MMTKRSAAGTLSYEIRNGPQKLDSVLGEISMVVYAAFLKDNP
jgi:hypothetical protein